jgi:hypothetical protein
VSLGRFCLFAEEEGGETLEEHRKRSRARAKGSRAWVKGSRLPREAPSPKGTTSLTQSTR